jgi:hypothetical protein
MSITYAAINNRILDKGKTRGKVGTTRVFRDRRHDYSVACSDDTA